MKKIDTTDEGEITYDEFVESLSRRAWDSEGITKQEKHLESKEVKEEKYVMRVVEEALNNHFSSIRKAFKHVDLDNSGYGWPASNSSRE